MVILRGLLSGDRQADRIGQVGAPSHVGQCPRGVLSPSGAVGQSLGPAVFGSCPGLPVRMMAWEAGRHSYYPASVVSEGRVWVWGLQWTPPLKGPSPVMQGPFTSTELGAGGEAPRTPHLPLSP